MPWGAIRHYGRKIVVSEVAFDDIVSEDVKENRHNSLFCSSDSSHTSSLNSSVTLFVDYHTQKPTTRQTRKIKKQNCSQSKHENKKKKTHNVSEEQPNSGSGSSLFHECSLVICTPVKAKKKKLAVKETNSKTSATQAKPVRRQNKLATDENVQFTENLPDFDAIEQDDFFISSTPSGPQQYCENRLGENVCVLRSSSLDVSDISAFENSGVAETENSLLPGNCMQPNQANITFRNHKRKIKHQQKQLEDKRSPDSGNLSDNDADSSLLYELVDTSRLCDVEPSSPKCGIITDTSHCSQESSLVSASSQSCSVQDLSHSFRVMQLRSHDLTQKLLRSSQISTARCRNLLDFNDDSVPSKLSVSPDLFLDSSLSVDDHSPPLTQITEEDSCYSDVDYENEESKIEESESNEGSEDESNEVVGEEYEVKEDNEELVNRECDKEIEDSLRENHEEELLPDQQNSSKSNVTLYELVNSMSFSEKLSRSSMCQDVTFTASQRVLALCSQQEPVSFADCITPMMMSRCVKIGEGVYGEVFRSFSHGEAVALKIIPIEGSQHVNGCPQKKFDEILPEIVIAKELSDLATCCGNQTGNFCQVNRVSCVQGVFPGKLLEQWDVYSQQKVAENDRPDMYRDDQLFVVFEFLDGGCPLENYKFVNHTEALSALRQIVFALAVAESHLEFEHRDLHIGNVLVRPCQEDIISFVLCGREYQFPSAGVRTTIIDFTISRLQKDGCAVFCDVSSDEGLFEGEGDFQFDVYRNMRTENGNDWQKFCPHSNILWVNYLLKKLMSVIKFQDTGRNHRNAQRHLRSMVDTVLDYSCCIQMAQDTQLWQVSA